jgi:hypothetical protein
MTAFFDGHSPQRDITVMTSMGSVFIVTAKKCCYDYRTVLPLHFYEPPAEISVTSGLSCC